MSSEVEGLENLNKILTLPKRNRDILHQHDRTQQRQTLKGTLMLTTTLLICIIALLIFRK